MNTIQSLTHQRIPMKILLYTLLSLAIQQTASSAPTIDPDSIHAKPLADSSISGYQLAWSDEFNAPQLDLTKWAFRTDSKMWSTQLPENVSIANGHLILHLKKQESKGKHYTGGGVISKSAFKFGYYECKMKTPPGAGWHTSFWMMKHTGIGGTDPKTASVELDAIENDSVHPMSYGVNLHQWNPKPHKSFGGKSVKTPNLSADFHIYGCEYTAKSVTYFFDGKRVQSIDTSKLHLGDLNIWLTSIASNLGKTTAVDNAKLPAKAEYDYVRFFQKAEQ